MAIAGGILGLVAGVIGFLITHVVELIYDIIPGIEYNSTFWTVGGAGIVAIVATIAGGIAGLLLTPFSAFPYIPVLGNVISTAVIGTLLGATSGMIIGFGVGIIALAGA